MREKGERRGEKRERERERWSLSCSKMREKSERR
jgi:hypothetical protein